MQSAKWTRRAVCFSVASGVVAIAWPQQGVNLTYQNRGRYMEGTRGSPSTGVSLDLIAALVDYREPYSQIPAKFQVLLYLPQTGDVSLTIREVEPEYYYWLDEAQPESGWQPGKMNRFQWPTGIVLRHLTFRNRPISLADLGAVARLGGENSDTFQVVAPVALYHSHPPAEAVGYRFVFRPAAGVHLTFTLSVDGTGAALGKSQEFPELAANEAQAVLWKNFAWPDGWYRISISGYKLSDNTRVDHRVRFYHRRELGR